MVDDNRVGVRIDWRSRFRRGARRYLAGGVLAILLLGLQACGGSGSDSSTVTPTATASPSPSPSPTPSPVPTPAGLGNVNHIIIFMQENHSFDNYLGTLPYVPGSPYHPPANPAVGCPANDSQCVDGLSCSGTTAGGLVCANSNYNSSARLVTSQHMPDECGNGVDPSHEWVDMHFKANYCDPNSTTTLGNGFVAWNHNASEVMDYYDNSDLPYYYALAQTFAISDRQFASLVGPTLPDRMYAMAATSFGHDTTNTPDDYTNGPPGYQPITGSIFDLLDNAGQAWNEFYECDAIGTPPVPYAQLFRYGNYPNYVHLSEPSSGQLYPEWAAATGVTGGQCNLPPVTYVSLYHTEHGTDDVRAGQYDASVIINDVVNGPCWKDSVLFLTYDEGGGYYDHATPPPAPSPDGIPPGLCADKSNPAGGSEIPGGGANCSASLQQRVQLSGYLQPGEAPADFTQLGFRVPLIAISPFAKPSYVSHVVGDHTSILRLIEERFTGGKHLNQRDAATSDLADMFDFVNAPSKNAVISVAAPTPAAADCNSPVTQPPQSCALLASPLPTPSGPTPTPAVVPTVAICPFPTPTAGG